MGLVNETADICANFEVGPSLYVISLEAPQIAGAIEPGQFVHMKIPQMEGHILRRPFSVYALDENAAGVLHILYQVVGFGTRRMTELAAGEKAELIGPCGYGWQPPEDARRALLVGGGVGAAPLYMLAERLAARGVQTDVVLGAQTEGALVCRDRYEGTGHACMRVACATDDGTFGRAGFCTSLADDALAQAAAAGEPYDYVATCGPEPLMRAVARMAGVAGVPCQVSMERRMACGVGACLSCVVETTSGKQRACANGPIFDAEEVIW